MPTTSVRYADHSAVLMPCIARVASAGHGRPASAAKPRRDLVPLLLRIHQHTVEVEHHGLHRIACHHLSQVTRRPFTTPYWV
jgi:hypothetical protein